MLFERAKACLKCMKHRVRQLGTLARLARVLNHYALAGDVSLHFADVPVGFWQDAPVREFDSLVAP
jgi:hypothetical protein